MTDALPIRPARGLRGGTMTADEMGDVLASIRRLIAQDDGARDAARPEPVAPTLHAVPDPVPEDAPPLRLRREALIPPAELPRHVQDGRSRLTAAPAVVNRPASGESARMTAIIRAATAARDRSELAHAETRAAPAPAAPPLPPERLGREPALDVAAAWQRELAGEATQEPVARPAPTASAVVQDDEGVWDVEATHADLTAQAEAETAPTEPETAPAVEAVMTRPAVQPAPSAPPVTTARALAEMEAAQHRPLDDPDSTALHLFAHTDEDVCNGALLRGLLREAIRQELQGEMGSRFSRNLRQLIRREVAAAMAEARSA